MNSFQRSFIKKSGYDNGWEVVISENGDCIQLSSSLHNRTVSVRYSNDQQVELRFEIPALVRELNEEIETIEGGCLIDEPLLPGILSHSARLARSLPYTPLKTYQKRCEEELSKTEINTTETTTQTRRRIGQDVFRESLFDYWDGKCAVTGIAIPELLRASHSKGWAECDNDSDRLNVFNGFLLCAHIDALYDKHLMSFDDEGNAIFSPKICSETLRHLNLVDAKLSKIDDQHLPFLRWQRDAFEQAENLKKNRG